MLLIGNTFPLALIRRPVTITPRPLSNLLERLNAEEFTSFWGHNNTIAAAKSFIGVDLSPSQERPALVLNEEGYPCLNQQSFREVWILSPDYTPGFRPAINQEVHPKQIVGWQALQITFS